MDNFMDKLAQKFSAQEMIKANSEAETNEMKKMRIQISEYEKILQEMRKLNYKNTEISEKLDMMIGENAEKLVNIKDDEQKFMGILRDITDEQTRNLESDQEMRRQEQLEKERQLEAQKESDQSLLGEITQVLESKFQSSDDFAHKENVKVYRNVQAVVVDELKKYTEQMQEENEAIKKRTGAAICMGTIAAVASICNVVIWVLAILVYMGIIG